MAKVLLVEGDIVWISVRYFKWGSGSDSKPTLEKYQVVRSNKTSAYVIRVEELNDEIKRELRVDQRTRKVKSGTGASICEYLYWESEKSFYQNLERKEQTAKAREKALSIINELSLEELNEFIGQYGEDNQVKKNILSS